ncbi:MAG: tRNA pseudouridine(13) synthase TruD [Acidobacteriota bacterium]
MARFRVAPEDFLVEELSLYPPDGDGPFLWLWVEKRSVDTAQAARLIAEHCDLPRKEVGWAGRKDRHAVSRQALTVPAQAAAALDSFDHDGLRILECRRTAERLRAGQLSGNRFVLTVRDVGETQAATATERLGSIDRRGLPNRFGAQRYGRDGRNVERGRRLLEGGHVRGDRRRAFFMISALQSQVFDEVLRRRPYDELWAGDLAVEHRSGDWTWIDDPEAHRAALDRFEISATGPIFGTKTRRPRGRAAALEAEVMADLGLPPVERLDPPKGLRLFGDRRALRVRPGDASSSYDPGALAFTVRFDLPPGSYATVVLEELFPDGLEEG